MPKKIRNVLSKYTKDQIIEKYGKYESVKTVLDNVPKKIAQIRNNKDLSDDEAVLIEEVDQYAVILNQLLEIYDEVYSLFA